MTRVLLRLVLRLYPSSRWSFRRGAQIVELVPSGKVLAVAGSPVNVVLNQNTGPSSRSI